MKKNSAIFLFKKDEESKYRYTIAEGSTTNLQLFQFLSRILNSCPKEISTWTQVDSLLSNNPYQKDNDTLRLQIIIYPPNDIINEGPSENVVVYGQESFINSDIKTPILHILLSDILSYNLYESKKKLHPSVPRYFQIIDSSIWNHYVPMVKFDDQEDGFYYLFTKTVSEIYENYQHGIYDQRVAKEYADVNARILLQSYLSENHSRHVAPFIFHSETTIETLKKKKLKNEYKELKEGFDKDKWRWRFLLIDDKAIEEENGKLKGNCKLSIIMRLIEKDLFPGEKDWIQYRLFERQGKDMVYSEKANTVDKNAKIVIDCVQHYDDAVAALKDKTYEIILLDYLLDGKDGQRKYGYELLEEINQQDTNDKPFKIGRDGKLYFIFISAYSTAVNERLLAQGLGRSEKQWFINTGACPTNTPQLFTYNLLHLMNQRLNDCGILILSTDKILELVKQIFKPTNKIDDMSANKKNSVRRRASIYYQEVLNLHYHFNKMLVDVGIPYYYYDKGFESIFNTKKSVLVSHYNANQHLSGLLEHLTNLVHIAAFGTIRQWDEMWEEYLYFKAAICKVDNSLKNDKSFDDLCGDIESFIFSLKSQQR